MQVGFDGLLASIMTREKEWEDEKHRLVYCLDNANLELEISTVNHDVAKTMAWERINNEKVQICRFLSKELAQEWKDVGRNIGLSDEALDHAEADSENREEANYKMLLQWARTNGSDATIEVLIQALKRANRKDLADFLEDGEGEMAKLRKLYTKEVEFVKQERERDRREFAKRIEKLEEELKDKNETLERMKENTPTETNTLTMKQVRNMKGFKNEKETMKEIPELTQIQSTNGIETLTEQLYHGRTESLKTLETAHRPKVLMKTPKAESPNQFQDKTMDHSQAGREHGQDVNYGMLLKGKRAEVLGVRSEASFKVPQNSRRQNFTNCSQHWEGTPIH